MSLPTPPRRYAWDASALLHLGRADRLDVLGEFVKGPAHRPWTHVTTENVAQELRRYDVLIPPWLAVHPLDSLAELTAFADWVALLSDGVHNVGEASVAAWAAVNGGVVILDDKVKSVVTANGLEAHGSVWMVRQAVRENLVDPGSMNALFNAAIADGARFGFGQNGAVDWARAKRIL